jgi:N-acetylglucosamine-6-phosphate deacetylase
MLLVTGAKVVRIDRIEDETDLLIDGKVIRAIGAKAREIVDAERAAGSTAIEEIDGRGRYLVPGFIDMHVHGTGEYLIDRGPADLAAICRLLPRYGVTSFLPTVVPAPPEAHRKLVASLAAGRYEGTRICGFFLEGPFLKLTGALPPDALVGLTAGRVDELKAACEPYPAIFAAAPDVEGIIDLIPAMASNRRAASGRVPVFITHTAATVKETQAGIEAGIRHATHFYDVFPCPPVTDPGVRPCGAVEAILADRRVTVDFILDGEHVDPIALRMAVETKGPGGVALVTDANLGAGLHPGRYQGIDGVEIEFAYEGAPARMTEKTRAPGSLAGSGLTMDRAVRNAVSLAGVSLVQAVRMASTNPASIIGTSDTTGSIDAGKLADLVLLDESLEVERTWIAGECCYRRDDRPGSAR